MYRRLMLALACLASIAISMFGFAATPVFAGYPEGAMHIWEGYESVYTDWTSVSSDPVLRGAGDNAIEFVVTNKNNPDDWTFITHEMLFDNRIHVDQGDTLYLKVDIRAFYSDTLQSGVTFRVSPRTWRYQDQIYFVSTGATATNEWQTVELNVVFDDSDLINGFRPYVETAWKVGERTYKVQFDNLAYRIDQGDDWTLFENGGSPVGVEGDSPLAPGVALALHQNAPNPFNPSTSIRYELAAAGAVSLAVFDVQGGRVATLVNETQTEGSHVVHWDGTSAFGTRLPSGVYVYRLETAHGSETRSMMIVK